METKKCITCLEKLPLNLFHKRNKKRKDGSVLNTTQSMCKSCSIKRRREYYLQNEESEKLKKRDRSISIRSWFQELKKTHKCSKCDDDRWYILDYHHINDDKEKNIAEIVSRDLQ